eukprot:8416357-Alexandrium_andersonii.AAC.1
MPNIYNCSRRLELELCRPKNGLKCPSCKASSGGFCAIVRAESDGDGETGRRARQRRFSGG